MGSGENLDLKCRSVVVVADDLVIECCHNSSLTFWKQLLFFSSDNLKQQSGLAMRLQNHHPPRWMRRHLRNWQEPHHHSFADQGSFTTAAWKVWMGRAILHLTDLAIINTWSCQHFTPHGLPSTLRHGQVLLASVANPPLIVVLRVLPFLPHPCFFRVAVRLLRLVKKTSS